jgi:hypothetical protein
MSMGKVLGGGSSVNANSSGYRDLALLGERFHVIEPERWNKMFSHQVSSAATPVSLESLAREKMSQNHITYDVSQSSWPINPDGPGAPRRREGVPHAIQLQGRQECYE